MKQLKKYIKYIIILVIIGGLFFLFAPKQKNIAYTTEKAKRGTVEQIVSVTGTVEADPQITLHFQKPGKIMSIKTKIGDPVKAGDILASTDTKSLKIQSDQATSGVDMAKANLNLRLVGPSNEEIAISQTAIDSVTVAYNASLSSLEQIKKSTEENRKKAELSVATAQIAIDNAKKQYDNALASQGTTTQSSNQSLQNAYDNAKSAINLALISIKTSLSAADSLLGIDQSNSPATQYKNFLGATDASTRSSAETAYTDTKATLKTAETTYQNVLSTWKDTEVEDVLKKTETSLFNAKLMLSSTYNMLNNSINGGTLTQTILDGYKNTIATNQTSNANNLNSVQTIIQSIANAKLGLTSTGISTSSSVDNAKASMDIAQNNLTIAQRSLEQTLVENEKAIVMAQADVAMKKVSIDSAKASYNAKVAKPRAVDVASLKAQVLQAESTYALTKQALQDAQIIAPIDGIITEVNIDVGENATGAENAIVMNAPKLQVKANVSETDITKVRVGDAISMTLDAFPPDKVFKGTIADINPAQTVIQGVIYYTITAMFDINDPDIKAGMTTNLDVTTNKKEDVLLVSPQTVQYKENKPFVRILDKGQPIEKAITVGVEGNKEIEILDGIKEGDDVILFEK